jgi:hypothetical protein
VFLEILEKFPVFPCSYRNTLLNQPTLAYYKCYIIKEVINSVLCYIDIYNQLKDNLYHDDAVTGIIFIRDI